MLLVALTIAVGLILLFAGAQGLVRGISTLALRMGITPLVVGLTVVAFGTSLPEVGDVSGRGPQELGRSGCRKCDRLLYL